MVVWNELWKQRADGRHTPKPFLPRGPKRDLGIGLLEPREKDTRSTNFEIRIKPQQEMRRKMTVGR